MKKIILSLSLIIQFHITIWGSGKDADSVEVYLIKSHWHVGFLLSVNDNLLKRFSFFDSFENYDFIDIGWGDEDFYQNDDIDYFLGAKAILFPTNSVLRVSGHSSGIERIIYWSDYCLKLTLNRNSFNMLLDFIYDSFLLINETPVVTLEKHGGMIKYYRSVHKYHLFNTCNKWIAKGLEYAGLNVSSSGIITAEDLIKEVSKTGEVIK